jgi:hypothetical protein
MKTIHIPAIAAIVLCQSAFAQTDAAFESGVLLNASDLLPAELLRGESHRVRDLVATDGYMAHFEIDSDFGSFDAIGVPQAKSRIAEIEAIRKLVETSKGDLFAEGLKRSIEQPIDAVKNIVTHPVQSVKQAPATVGHFFTKVGSAIGRAGGKVKDSIENDSPAPTGTEIGRAARNAAGFDKAKLDTARQLGIDPYSDNARLQEEMDKVTWAFFAGGLPLRVGAAVASAGVAVAATNMIGIPQDTYTLTQSELALRDGRSLAAMGITDEDIKTFQLYGPLSTTRRHRIVKSLEALPTAAGRGRIIQLANSCETTEQTDFLISALSILSDRQLSGAADYKALHVHGRLPAASTADGTMEIPAPMDHVTWTEQVATFATRDDLKPTAKRLIHTGHLSEPARNGLAAAGWKVESISYP